MPAKLPHLRNCGAQHVVCRCQCNRHRSSGADVSKLHGINVRCRFSILRDGLKHDHSISLIKYNRELHCGCDIQQSIICAGYYSTAPSNQPISKYSKCQWYCACIWICRQYYNRLWRTFHSWSAVVLRACLFNNDCGVRCGHLIIHRHHCKLCAGSCSMCSGSHIFLPAVINYYQ